MTATTMDVSIEMPDAFPTFRRQKVDTLCPSSSSCQLPDDTDIIDSSKLQFSDDEIWLCECSSRSDTDLHKWLYDIPDTSSKPSPKNIDTRTFTRPKKRFTRPSIEKYNEELYGNELNELVDSGIQLNGGSLDESPVKPLQFDLGQNATSVYFDNILANAPMADSFQNMSPPSLVNSMCSSTFANLMESSFIKNDPVLKEIRDTDFTVSILQHETEPMFQSITESYSSLNSDVPENFLKKMSFTEKSDCEGDATVIVNKTFEKDQPADQTITIDNDVEDFQDAKATSYEDLNSTYPRRSNARNIETVVNNTFQRRKLNRSSFIREEQHLSVLNTTHPITVDLDKTIENVKRLLDRRPSPSLDLNRLSYIVDKPEQTNVTYTHEGSKRNSFGSTDSGENLDYMSLSSGSSRSSKPQSIDGINTLIDNEQPKFNKRQSIAVSTPSHGRKAPSVLPNHDFSPIRDRNSDPEMSSNEQPQSVIRKQKSVGNISRKVPTRTIPGSQPNLRFSGMQRPTNLNSMGHALKGSYTSLKPMNPNLPVAPPPLDTTVKNVAQVTPMVREIPKSQDAQFVRPQPRSGLPRPVTGIPRPVSRIPGPKPNKPISKSAGHQGRY